jgi:hypothetical protein
MSHDTLENHIKTNFNLKHHHGWSFTEMDEMVPWERAVYVELIRQKIHNEEQLERDAANIRRR